MTKNTGKTFPRVFYPSVPGIFSCGNCRRVMDLADFVTVQGLAAGYNAGAWVLGKELKPMPEETSNAMAKGLPQPGILTCVLCPKGCRVTIGANGETGGNQCPKGEEYARQEVTAPARVLTTTVKRADGSLLPVKTGKPVPRERMTEFARKLRTVTVPNGPLPCGNVLLRDPFGVEADVLSAE